MSLRADILALPAATLATQSSQTGTIQVGVDIAITNGATITEGNA